MDSMELIYDAGSSAQTGRRTRGCARRTGGAPLSGRRARSVRDRIIASDPVPEATITVHAALTIAGDLAGTRRELAIEVGTMTTTALGAG
jgi:hypothetical protein